MPDPNLSINEGAILYYKYTVNTTNLDWAQFKVLLDHYHISCDKAFKDLSEDEVDIILNGSKEIIDYTLTSSSGNTNKKHGFIEGVKTRIERLYNETSSEFNRQYYAKFLKDTICTTCNGARLNESILNVFIDNKSIYDVCLLTLDKLYQWINDLKSKLSENQLNIASLILNEIINRTKFLLDVGLEYLTLARYAMSLSGGEAQRIRLATQIGSKLSGVLYVLDEPSIGLHQRDSAKLIASLKEMRDLGNTLIVVEHDEEMIKAADYIVDVGPKAGIHGGEIVAEGSLKDIEENENSLTGDYLSGRKEIKVPNSRRKGNGKFIELKGYDSVEVADRLTALIQEYYPTRVFLDLGNSGAGVYDILAARGYSEIVKGVNFGGKAIKSDRYFNKRAEMYGEACHWLSSNLPVQIPNDDDFLNELFAVRLGNDEYGRLKLEKKEIIREELGRSPDKADAFVLTFAEPVYDRGKPKCFGNGNLTWEELFRDAQRRDDSW